MGWIGIELDHAANASDEQVISTDLSRARVMVIPTDEEGVIARAAGSFLDPGRCFDLIVTVESGPIGALFANRSSSWASLCRILYNSSEVGTQAK